MHLAHRPTLDLVLAEVDAAVLTVRLAHGDEAQLVSATEGLVDYAGGVRFARML